MRVRGLLFALFALLPFLAQAGSIVSLFAYQNDVSHAKPTSSSREGFFIPFDLTGLIVDSAQLWYKASNGMYLSGGGRDCPCYMTTSDAGTGQIVNINGSLSEILDINPYFSIEQTIADATALWYGDVNVMQFIGGDQAGLYGEVQFRNTRFDRAGPIFYNARLDISYHIDPNYRGSSVPVPATLPLVLIAGAAMGLIARRRTAFTPR